MHLLDNKVLLSPLLHGRKMKKTFDTLRGHESRPQCHDTVLRYAVTLQVWTHRKMNNSYNFLTGNSEVLDQSLQLES